MSGRYLKQRDGALHAEAKATIEAYYKTNNTSKAVFLNLMRALVGVYRWRKARECFDRMLKRMALSRSKGIKSEMQSSDAISVKRKKLASAKEELEAKRAW